MIFRNFKGAQDEYLIYEEIYNKKVILLRQSKYKFYTLLFNLLGFLFIVIYLSIVSYFTSPYMLLLGLPIISCMVFYSEIISEFLGYYFYFIIITPEEIIVYNQSFFSSHLKTINLRNLKTISAIKNGYLRSTLNYGYIDFLFEKDESVGIDFIENIDLISRQIQNHIKK